MGYQEEFTTAEGALDAFTFEAVHGRTGPAQALTAKQKAAVMVRLMISTEVPPGLNRLHPDTQVDLGRTLADLGPISRTTLAAVLEEFTTRLGGLALTSSESLQDTLRMLEPHISPVARDKLRAEADRQDHTDPWGRLSDMPPNRLAPLLASESTEVCAVLLSKLSVAKAAGLLRDLPPERAEMIAHAVSLTSAVPPKTVADIGLYLVAQVQTQPSNAFDASPVDRVGALLNALPTAARETLLTGLDGRDPDFARDVRKAIFTFNHFPTRLEPTDVPRVLRLVEPDVLTTALAAGMEIAPISVEFILSNMSKRLAEQLREEVEAKGKVREEDGDVAIGAIISAVRELEERGELRLLPSEE